MTELAHLHQLPLPESANSLMSWSKNNFTCQNKDELCTWLWNQTQSISLNGYLQEKKPYLTTHQINELLSAGYELGAHSKTHPFFDKLTFEEAEVEMIGSIIEIKQTFNTLTPSFSYPFGNRAKTEIENEGKTKNREGTEG